MSEIAQRTPSQELVARVRGDEFRQQVSLALPENVHPDRFVRVMATALLDNPELATKADHASIFQAGLKAAADGLLPDGREAAFVLFKDKAAYIPMIGGYRKIAAEHGWSIRTRVVYQGDRFEYELGLDQALVHHPTGAGSRGPLVAAYAIGAHRDGRRELEVLTAEDVAKARAVSRAAQRGPWVEWEERMWEKTAGRRLFAKLPLADSDRVGRVLQADALAEMLGGRAAGDVLYGREPQQTPAALSSPRSDPPRGGGMDGGEPHGAGGAVENGPVGAEPVPPPAAAEPETVEGHVVEIDDPVIAEAAAQIPPRGKYSKSPHGPKTIGQIHAEDAQYIEWAARAWDSDTPEDQHFKAALTTFVAFQDGQAQL